MTRRALPAAVFAIVSALLLVLLIFLGSRGFKDFDSALIGYAVATVFALAAIVYRYTLWITRPPTWRYFKGGWLNFLSWCNFRRYTSFIPLAWWHDIFGQTFILRRSLARWVAHMSIFWGVLLSLAITLPLTFGWLRFSLIPPDLGWRGGPGRGQYPRAPGSRGAARVWTEELRGPIDDQRYLEHVYSRECDPIAHGGDDDLSTAFSGLLA